MSDLNEIEDRIAEMESHLYTGMLKFGFQNGILVSYVESDILDPCLIAEGIDKGYLMLKMKQLCNPWQSGAVSMAYRRGKFVGGSHLATWKGRTLKNFKERWGCRNALSAGSQLSISQ